MQPGVGSLLHQLELRLRPAAPQPPQPAEAAPVSHAATPASFMRRATSLALRRSPRGTGVAGTSLTPTQADKRFSFGSLPRAAIAGTGGGGSGSGSGSGRNSLASTPKLGGRARLGGGTGAALRRQNTAPDLRVPAPRSRVKAFK
jgi:hypothetical protein